MSKDVILEVKDVRKTIRRNNIIKGISFSVHPGEVFGFLGPNGSGKTTTIRMLVGLIRPSAGTIKVCGYDIQKFHSEALEKVGSIVENPELYTYLTGMENLEHFARMIPGVTRKRIDEVIELVDLTARINDTVKEYSLGMRQRLGIAQALLGNPRLLILDEPTNGLDPQGIKELRAFIRRLADQGMSVFISSHLLSEIQLMCDRVAIINKGEIVRVGKVNELLYQSYKRIVWHVEPSEQVIAILSTYNGVTIVDDPTVEDGVATEMEEDVIPQVAAEFVNRGFKLYGVEWKKPSLEDLFLHMTEGESNG